MKKVEIIPVIHIVDDEQVFSNIEVCLQQGVTKVMLINMRGSGDKVTRTMLTQVKRTYHDLWVGINLLGSGVVEMIAHPMEGTVPEAVWSDRLLHSLEVEKAGGRKFGGMLFGGFYFKYQAQPKDLDAACKDVVKCVDVVTTSGPATGLEADLGKLMAIRQRIGSHPFAVASGVDSMNVKRYRGLMDYALVASSITSPQEYILPHRLSDLLENAGY